MSDLTNDVLITLRDAKQVLCNVTCKPGPRCPDTYCREINEAFKDVKTISDNRIHAGNTIYHVCYEPDFPDEAGVIPYAVDDVSEKGLVYIAKDNDWYDTADPAERLFRTRKEAQALLDKLLEGVKDGKEV